MKKMILALSVFVLLFAACARKPAEVDARTAEYIEAYIMQLRDIEKVSSEKFNVILAHFEILSENPSDEVMYKLAEAVASSLEANRNAINEFRNLAVSPKPYFVDDTIYLMLTTATALLGQSYEIRNEAQTSLNRYISLRTMRFFREYTEQMETAMQFARQAYFFITSARIRQRVLAGDTLDMSIEEFLNIPELPRDETAPDETAVAEEE